jgi:hypothetical protein
MSRIATAPLADTKGQVVAQPVYGAEARLVVRRVLSAVLDWPSVARADAVDAISLHSIFGEQPL